MCALVYLRLYLCVRARVCARAGVLCCVVLCCAVLCCVVLCCAVLCCAVLCCAVLCCVVLCRVVSGCVASVLSLYVVAYGEFCNSEFRRFDQ